MFPETGGNFEATCRDMTWGQNVSACKEPLVEQRAILSEAFEDLEPLFAAAFKDVLTFLSGLDASYG